MESIIEIQNLDFYYGKCVLFKNLNLKIRKNSYTSIIGKVGSGKSTLANILIGNYKYNGKIIINNILLNKKNKKNINSFIGYVKGYMEPVFSSVYLELSNSYFILGYDEDKINIEIKKLLKKYNISYLLDKKFNEISIGERQIVILLSKIILNKKILILDDALISLDNKNKSLILKELKRMSKDTTIINITSDIEEITNSTDIVILSETKELINSSYTDIIKDESIFVKNNLKLPFYADLSNKLKYYNLLSKPVLSKEKMVEKLWN